MRISKKIVITLSVVLLLIIINLCNNANAIVDGGDTLANATQISYATTRINLGASFFKFIPSETQVYTIKTSNAVKGSDEYLAPPDTFGSLYDSSHNLITTGINGGSGYDYAEWDCQDGGGDGDNFLFTCSLTARQTYYIYIQDWNMAGSAPFNTCDLEITGGGLISPPTDIAITASSINATATGNNVTVGTLSTTDPDAGDTFTYSIQGGANAGSFNILGNVLRTNTVLAAGSYNLTIRSTDNAELYYDKEFTVIVNGKPSDIAITASSINATDTGNNITVGNLSSIDPNADDTFTYSIQGGDGAGSFNILGTALRTNNSLAAGSYNLTIRSTDNAGLYYDKVFTVIVNGEPTDIAITASSINAADTGNNITVGMLSSTDPNTGNTFTYSIQGGAGAGSFNIVGTALRTNNSLAAGSYSLTIRSTDNTGLYYDKAFTVIVNGAPTDIAITASSINATDTGNNATVGTLSSTDPNAENTFTYSIQGGADAGSFNISGAVLRTNEVLAAGSYSLTIRSVDNTGLYYDKAFTVIVNGAPTSIAITASSINATDTGINATVGTLSSTDPNAENTFTYSIQGGADAGSFNISGAVLRTNAVLTAGSYSLTIRSTDNTGLYYDKAFTVIVNGAPTDIVITTSSINATDTGSNTTVGTLSSTDPNTGNTFTYSIQGGAGAGSFNIVGTALRTNNSLAAGSYSLTIRSTDNTGLYYDKAFTVIVNGAPTDIAITASSINATYTGNNATVGTLSSTDPNAENTFTYSIQGGADAVRFNISGAVLRTNAVLAAGSYSLTIRSTDNTGLYYDKAFTVIVNGAPTDIAITTSSINATDTGNNATVGTLSSTDPNAGNTFTYGIQGGDGAGSFNISGAVLRTNAVLAAGSYNLTIRSTDNTGLYYDKSFTVIVNGAPTDIAITASSINAIDTGNNATVGTLSSTDPNAGNTFTYSIQGGAGAGSFNILGTVLRTNAVLAAGSYSLTIRSTDNTGLYYDKAFTVIVNGKPTDIAITASSINATDTGINATVGTLSSTDPNAGNTFTYSIQGGTGAGSFNILGTALRTNDSLAAGSYSLTIRSTDNTGLYYDKAFTVVVNGAPTDIAITTSSINTTDTGINATVGTLSTTDPNTGNTFTYSIHGGADAESFNISGNILRTNSSLAVGSYSLIIRSADNTGLYYDKTFIISVVSIPTIVSSTVAENNAYIDVTFNTPVRGAGDGTTLIDPAKFSANFLANGGTATGVTISDIKKTDGETVETATAIDGTETTVRFFLTVTATPNGAETIEIRPANGISVYDVMGTAMAAVQTGGINNLKDQKSPIIQSVEKTSNTSITVILSENCTNIDKANDGGFTVEKIGSPATTYAVSSIAQGSDARHVILTVADISASAEKGVKIKYTAGGNGTIQDIAGNIMATDSTGKAINAWRSSTNNSTSTSSAPIPTQTPTPTPSAATTTGPVSVDNKVPVKATVVTKEVEGKKVTTVTIDNELDNEIKKIGNNATVIIDLTKIGDKSDVAIVQLNGQTVKEMEHKEVVLEIKTESATYTLPASQINIDSVSDKLGKDVKLKDIVVDVKIAVPSQETAKIVENTAKNKNYTVVVKPIDFNITCKNSEKTVEVSKFNGYVERMLAVPEGVDPSKITTGIVLNKDGTFSHVPTTVTKDNNRHYAKINSLTNSTYSVIWNPRTFKDVEKHWAKDSINDMGSRLVIEGVGGDNFAPDKNITRAEFASIVVKALGLMRPGTGKDTYTDVTKADWYYDAVSIASEYGIINGYGKGKFGPTDKITREQAAAMITRAAKITGLKSQLNEGEAENLLSVFKDTAGLSSWSMESLAACVKSGMISGKNSITLAPKDFTTRAEVAVIVKRLLQKSNLIN